MTSQSLWVEASPQLDQLFKAHAAATGAVRNAPRNCVSHFAKKDKQGQPIPDYADLAMIFDTIRSALAANGLSVTQSFMPFGQDGTMMLVTTLGHASGQFQRSFLPMKGNVPPQQLAAAATYLKRVAICALVGIAADDDDDGVVANGTAAVAAVNDERVVEERATKAIKDAKTQEGRQKVLDHAAKLVSEGSLPTAALKRLQGQADQLDVQPQAAIPSARKVAVAAS
jgi:hypothetical protein